MAFTAAEFAFRPSTIICETPITLQPDAYVTHSEYDILTIKDGAREDGISLGVGNLTTSDEPNNMSQIAKGCTPSPLHDITG
jgi:hypothetical protein